MAKPSPQELYEWAFGQMDKPTTPKTRDNLLLLGGQYILAPFAVGYGVGVKVFNRFLLDKVKASAGKTLIVRLGVPVMLGAVGVMLGEGLFLTNLEALRKESEKGDVAVQGDTQ